MEPMIILIIILALIIFVTAFVLITVFWIFPASDGPKGPQGNKGSDGIQGFQGPRGLQGPRGSIIGDQGPQGPIGITGPLGYKGYLGATGATGYTGETGITGINFLATLQAESDIVFSLDPGFSGGTGGIGQSLIFSDLSILNNPYSTFSILDVSKSQITLPSGKYNLYLNMSIDTKLPFNPTTLYFDVLNDISVPITDANNTLRIPSSYLGSKQSYVVPIKVNTSGTSFIEIQATNQSEIFVTDPSQIIVSSDYTANISDFNLVIKGFDL